jgi:hypothetical protein
VVLSLNFLVSFLQEGRLGKLRLIVREV